MHIATLARWRKEGYGPKWIRVGKRKVFYRESDLALWFKENETLR